MCKTEGSEDNFLELVLSFHFLYVFALLNSHHQAGMTNTFIPWAILLVLILIAQLVYLHLVLRGQTEIKTTVIRWGERRQSLKIKSWRLLCKSPKEKKKKQEVGNGVVITICEMPLCQVSFRPLSLCLLPHICHTASLSSSHLTPLMGKLNWFKSCGSIINTVWWWE